MMLKSMILIVLISGIINAQYMVENYYKIGFSENSFHDVEKDDAIAIVNVLGEKLVEEYDKDAEGTSIIFDVESELQSFIDSGVDLFILLASEYINFENNSSLIPAYSIDVGGEIGFKYHLIVNNQSRIETVLDLKDNKIALLANNNNSPTYRWLAALLKNKNLGTPENYFSEIILHPKANGIILSLFFNKIDACLTTSTSYDIAAELNPQLENQLKIIETSPVLLAGMICFNQSIIDTKEEQVLINALGNLHKNDFGKQLLDLYRIDRLIPFKKEHLNSTKNILDQMHK